MLSRRPFTSIAVCGLAALVGSACGDSSPTDPDTTPDPPPVDKPPPLDPLPPIQATETERFRTSGACSQCHLAGDGDTLRDADGRDLSPVGLWQTSMMAFAARDPYYLATFSHELDAAPATAFSKDDIEIACTRCHAPASSLEHERSGGHPTFEELTAGTTPEANLARDGITCTMCHQIRDANLGDVESFGGGFDVGFDRLLFGPHMSPNTQPMQFFIEFTPTYATHIGKSELCATCHTVITPVVGANGELLGGDFLEQASYLEWQNSSNPDEGTECASCHLPATAADGSAIVSPLTTYPVGSQPRSPFGRHLFVGASSAMLDLLGANLEWTGSSLSPDLLFEAAGRARDHLASAAALTVLDAQPDAADLLVSIAIQNRTGHKLPTGYPTRRMWLHVTAFDGANVVFESGAYDASGALVDGAGQRLDSGGSILPHLDVVEDDGEVQVWEAIPVDARGDVATRPLAAARYGKDNRILPAGWSSTDAWIDWIAPVGADDDSTFVPGSDQVQYRIKGGASSVDHLDVELLYQSIPPSSVEILDDAATPATVRFVDQIGGVGSAVVVMATAAIDR
ncbi:MAG: hypothetical protein U0271_30430 [Polyangiaceae bacterium]